MGLKSLFVAGAMALGLLVAAPQADAAFLGHVSLNGPIASSGVSGTMGVGDVAVMTGSIDGKGVAFQHTLMFTAEAGKPLLGKAVSVDILEWVGIENLKVTLNGIEGAGGTVVQANALAGSFANTLVVSGVTSGLFGGNYKADVVLTPIPGAALLLGSALAGVAYMRRRKAQVAA
jgi:hypothetical protein